MPIKKNKNNESEQLALKVAEAILEKKGEKVILLNLSKIENSVAKYFIVCHATSNTQVRAISDNIEEKTRIDLGEKVWKSEGHENAQWVLLDYGDVVVHVFQKEYRFFYNIEELWADADSKEFTDNDFAKPEPEKKSRPRKTKSTVEKVSSTKAKTVTKASKTKPVSAKAKVKVAVKKSK